MPLFNLFVFVHVNSVFEHVIFFDLEQLSIILYEALMDTVKIK